MMRCTCYDFYLCVCAKFHPGKEFYSLLRETYWIFLNYEDTHMQLYNGWIGPCDHLAIVISSTKGEIYHMKEIHGGDVIYYNKEMTDEQKLELEQERLLQQSHEWYRVNVAACRSLMRDNIQRIRNQIGEELEPPTSDSWGGHTGDEYMWGGHTCDSPK